MRNFHFFLASIFLFLTPFFVLADCPPQTYVEREKQELDQYKCTKGACGGVIEFMKRRAERECKRECTKYYIEVCDQQGNCTCEYESTSCGPWTCDPWEFKNERVIKTYDTSQTPWLVCTYRYDQLTDEEKQRAGVKYPYNKITCLENNCPEVDEITWFPPVFNSDSRDYFHQKIKGRSFFQVAQVTCWGKCLDSAGGPHYFSGPINPKRKEDNEEQDPNKVKLPAKFGWELNLERNGMNEWEEAIDWARKKCKEGLESGGSCPYPSPPYQESQVRGILRDKWGDAKYREKFEIRMEGGTLIRGLGAGSFRFDNPVEKFLPLVEGQEIPEWQTPASGENDVEWTRRQMYDYFDYYFLSKTAYSATKLRYGFSGEIGKGRLFVYSPSQDSKSTFLWVEYKDPRENNLTKQIRSRKIGGSHQACEIAPFSSHEFNVYPCCGSDPENCLPQKPRWQFSTLGPEIKSILGIRGESSRLIYPYHVKDIPFDALAGVTKEEGKGRKVEGKIYRFIDIDWDRVWPSKKKREELLRGMGGNLIKDYIYVGQVSFDSFDGGEKNECQKECWAKCDQKCLSSGTCEKQCYDECKVAYQKSKERCQRYYKGDRLAECLRKVDLNYQDCNNACQKNFEERRQGCPNCKSEDQGMGCVICESCMNSYECSEKCVEDCYQRKKNEGKLVEEIKDCDEVCVELDEKTRFVAINKECDLLPARNKEEENLKKKCKICQDCKFKVEFVDVEVCPIGNYYVGITPLYKARIEEKFPIEKFYKMKEVEKCESINKEPFCPSNPCECYQYNQKGEEILGHSGCATKITDNFLENLYARARKESLPALSCELSPNVATSSCLVWPQVQNFEFPGGEERGFVTPRSFYETLKITSDAYKEFGEVESEKIKFNLPFKLFEETLEERVPWWEWDKHPPTFSSFVPNSAIAFSCSGGPPRGWSCQGQSLRWDFKINSFPKKQTCDWGQKNCFGDLEKEYPFCWEIEKPKINSYLQDFFESSEKMGEDNIYGIYRTQVISLPYERVSSFRLKIKEGNSYLEYLPKIPTQSPIKLGKRKTGEKFGIEFPISEIWADLPPLGNALGRLNKEFTFEFHPCGDETGFFCTSTLAMIQKARITGAPPPFPFQEFLSGPPPPKKIRIPHYFNWDPSLGAASYWLKFEGAENQEIFIPDLLKGGDKSTGWVPLSKDGQYTWKIRTCADLCDQKGENVLQCGPYGVAMAFEGYNLFPPKVREAILEFLPGETISLGWTPVNPQGIDCTHVKVTYSAVSKEENRKDCLEKAKQNYLVIETTLRGDVREFVVPNELLPTSAETLTYNTDGGQVSTNICLGNYTYEIYYCTGENCAKKVEECSKGDKECLFSAACQERGSPTTAYFSIVTKKMPEKRIGGAGFGTCQRFIHCRECHLSDLPKIISNILNCLLWTVSPIAGILLLLYTGIGLYFSFGAPEAVERAKRIWKMVGIGWLIMLFSWTIVNLIIKTFHLP
jgi:hypothetical protein